MKQNPGLAEPSNARNLHAFISLRLKCYRRTKLREKWVLSFYKVPLSHFGATKILENYTNIFNLRISCFKECDQIAMK